MQCPASHEGLPFTWSKVREAVQVHRCTYCPRASRQVFEHGIVCAREGAKLMTPTHPVQARRKTKSKKRSSMRSPGPRLHGAVVNGGERRSALYQDCSCQRRVRSAVDVQEHLQVLPDDRSWVMQLHWEC